MYLKSRVTLVLSFKLCFVFVSLFPFYENNNNNNNNKNKTKNKKAISKTHLNAYVRL